MKMNTQAKWNKVQELIGTGLSKEKALRQVRLSRQTFDRYAATSNQNRSAVQSTGARNYKGAINVSKRISNRDSMNTSINSNERLFVVFGAPSEIHSFLRGLDEQTSYSA